jgi:hypothetical protein
MQPDLHSTGPVTESDAEDGKVYFDFVTSCALVSLSFGAVVDDVRRTGERPRLRNWAKTILKFLRRSLI